MNWISPNFGSDGIPAPPPKKRTKIVESISTKTPLYTFQTSPSCNWLEKYKPAKFEDLVVNIKKIKEVESWLESSTHLKSSSKFLLLTGPSGCGKTTTLCTVCKSLGIKIFEWITPLDRPDDSGDFPSKFEFAKSAAKQFEEYVFRSSRYNSCFSANLTNKVVLVKDFPNIFIRNPTTFHEILERASDFCINPVVFVCSDESTCKKLFSCNLKMSCQFQTITFNPIPEQKIFRFLKNLLVRETKVNKKIKMLSDEPLNIICAASQGDLRIAVSKLYFCTINSNFDITQSKSKGKFKKPKTPDDNIETDKDKRLDFFHGMGRVLYPKKMESNKGIKFVHSTAAIVENFLCEPNSFLNQLHENYPTKMGNVHDLKDAAEKLSKSDTLIARWQDKDLFHEYALSVAIQGLMVSNKNPQKAKFEAFRKSQTSRLEVDSKAIELEGKALFSDLHTLDYGSLVDILPYSRMLLPNLNSEQLEYVRKTCQFR